MRVLTVSNLTRVCIDWAVSCSTLSTQIWQSLIIIAEICTRISISNWRYVMIQLEEQISEALLYRREIQRKLSFLHRHYEMSIFCFNLAYILPTNPMISASLTNIGKAIFYANIWHALLKYLLLILFFTFRSTELLLSKTQQFFF